MTHMLAANTRTMMQIHPPGAKMISCDFIGRTKTVSWTAEWAMVPWLPPMVSKYSCTVYRSFKIGVPWELKYLRVSVWQLWGIRSHLFGGLDVFVFTDPVGARVLRPMVHCVVQVWTWESYWPARQAYKHYTGRQWRCGYYRSVIFIARFVLCFVASVS